MPEAQKSQSTALDLSWFPTLNKHICWNIAPGQVHEPLGCSTRSEHPTPGRWAQRIRETPSSTQQNRTPLPSGGLLLYTVFWSR